MLEISPVLLSFFFMRASFICIAGEFFFVCLVFSFCLWRGGWSWGETVPRSWKFFPSYPSTSYHHSSSSSLKKYKWAENFAVKKLGLRLGGVY